MYLEITLVLSFMYIRHYFLFTEKVIHLLEIMISRTLWCLAFFITRMDFSLSE